MPAARKDVWKLLGSRYHGHMLLQSRGTCCFTLLLVLQGSPAWLYASLTSRPPCPVLNNCRQLVAPPHPRLPAKWPFASGQCLCCL